MYDAGHGEIGPAVMQERVSLPCNNLIVRLVTVRLQVYLCRALIMAATVPSERYEVILTPLGLLWSGAEQCHTHTHRPHQAALRGPGLGPRQSSDLLKVCLSAGPRTAYVAAATSRQVHAAMLSMQHSETRIPYSHTGCSDKLCVLAGAGAWRRCAYKLRPPINTPHALSTAINTRSLTS